MDTPEIPLRLTLDDADTPCDVIDALALVAFVSGEQPWARSARLARVNRDAALLPPGARVLRTAAEDGRRALLASGEGWTLRAVRWRSRQAEVSVTAVSDELARQVLGDAIRGAAQRREAADAVNIGFWHRSERRGAVRHSRPITTSPWPRIRANYPAPVAAAMDRLMGLTSAAVNGRLILLHGPPGTGKTTALRTLARHWRSWCQLDCVLDPEALFNDPAYLMEVAIGADRDDDDDDRGERWRLLLLEDCDELIRAEAKHASGQALSRLLNLTDGLLGQGRHVLLGITTNEDLTRLHPAVVRPGRCLAQIEVGRLSAAEATGWLGRPTGPSTLAELFAQRSGGAGAAISVSEPDDALAGCYL